MVVLQRRISKEVINAGANVLVAGTSVFKTNQKTTYKMNIDSLRG